MTARCSGLSSSYNEARSSSAKWAYSGGTAGNIGLTTTGTGRTGGWLVASAGTGARASGASGEGGVMAVIGFAEGEADAKASAVAGGPGGRSAGRGADTDSGAGG